ncbi:hypothetical protein L0F63_002077 [Massospora cicadina]|nr:hypothetical protein L0F63_002077 [Massospora cicadina]
MEQGLSIFLGVLASLAASLFDALGLNIQRRDHLVAQAKSKPRHECCRPGWHLGLYIYCGSQAFGSTLVLALLKAQWAAPLGAISLIFNFVFARYLVGTQITRRDLIGTLIVLAAILVIVLTGSFSKPDATLDLEENISLESLRECFNTLQFKLYFIILNSITLLAFAFCIYAKRKAGRAATLFSLPRESLKRYLGVGIAAVGGILASETLLLAKSGIQLIVNTINGSAFIDPLSFSIVFFLALTAILQIYCLNAGLKHADSVVVVPVFACTYNVFSISNAMFYFEMFSVYPVWAHLVTAIGVIILSVGIVILAHQKKVLPPQVPTLRFWLNKKVAPPELAPSPIPKSSIRSRPGMPISISASTTSRGFSINSATITPIQNHEILGGC